MNNRCPGSLGGTPTLKIKKCPECGGEVEVFSNDVQVKCDHCGFNVYNDLESCIQWCKYAKYCVGEELYKKLKRKRIAFIGVENAVRSVMAEALAKEINESPKLGFVSAGVNPADAVDISAVELLGEENITWRGKPKDIARIGQVDIYVLMGSEVELPEKFGADRIIRWEVPNPRNKDLSEYRRVFEILKGKINELIEMEVGQNDQKE